MFTSGRLFGSVPTYVDISKSPGFSTIPEVTVKDYIEGLPFLQWFWALCAVLFYFLFPYDLIKESPMNQSPINMHFFIARFPLWFALTLGYAGFWHFTLYYLNLSKQPFISRRSYNIDKVAHNMFWTISGVAIWTCFENTFVYLWSTGRLPYEEINFTPKGVLTGFITLYAVGFHFYFCHRFLHFKPLYEQV
jgi:hypothetical protein